MGPLRHTSLLILTDDAEFARLLTACWQAERQLARHFVFTSDLWEEKDTAPTDLVVVGPLERRKASSDFCVPLSRHRA